MAAGFSLEQLARRERSFIVWIPAVCPSEHSSQLNRPIERATSHPNEHTGYVDGQQNHC